MANAQTNATDDWVEIRPVTPARVQVDKKFKIPLIIHQSHAFNKLPRLLAECVQSWIELNPEFEHRYYDDQAMADYVHTHGSPEFIRAFEFVAALRSGINGAIKADLFRLLVLSREGGLWVDADYLDIKPIMTFLQPDDQFLCWICPDDGELRASFECMLAAPGHPFINAALEEIIAAQIYKKWLGLNRFQRLSKEYTGPIPFRRVMRSLAPSPPPRVAGVHNLAGHPHFTYTIRQNQLNGQLKQHMNDMHINAVGAMGMTHWGREYSRWNLRGKAIYLIANSRALPGIAMRIIKIRVIKRVARRRAR